MAETTTGYPVKTGYAPVNGLQMYYEVHSDDPGPGDVPVLLLHGAYMSTGDLGPSSAAASSASPS